MMTQYLATPKQRAFFRSLTGHDMPFKTSKTKASKMIEKAKAGEWKAPAKHVEVLGYQPYNTMLGDKNSPAGNYEKLTFIVNVDYRTDMMGFETFEAALAAAKAKYSDQEIIESPDSILRPYHDQDNNMLVYTVLPYKSWWFGRRQWGVYMCNSNGKSLIGVYDTEEEAEDHC